jgi:hypothetical protein
MRTWLRLTLVTTTVGGGFTGLVATLLAFSTSNVQLPYSLLPVASFVPLYAFVLTSGLIFVMHPERTRPLTAALLIQTLWISSPLVVYRFASGFYAVLKLSSPDAGTFGARVQTEFRVGCIWHIGWLSGDSWCIGINFFAIAILILLWRSVQSTNAVAQATSASD